ncbi:MAG: hypothetical protein AAF552_09280 [Pseudomonadota bacterium]
MQIDRIRGTFRGNSRVSGALFTLLLLIGSGSGDAQISGGPFEMRRSVMAGGGGLSTGGEFALEGTIAQPAVGTSFDGPYELSGGFWQGDSSSRPVLIFRDSYEG